MFDEEDDRPRKSAEEPTPRNLEGVSLDDLRDYRTFLEAEMGRVDHAIKQKSSVTSEAEALFKS
jgi:uncharacterized small protein (DUF1192 family)